MSPASLSVRTLLDEGRWGVYQRWLIFLAALTIIFDGIDNQLLGVVTPTIMREWSVARPAFAPIVSLGYFGMMLGGAAAGFAGDRIGRKRALLGTMLIFGAMTVAAASAASLQSLAMLRFLAGVGLGGAIPNAASLAAEYVPMRRRAFAVTLTIVCVPLGATFAGLVAIRALPVVGWRGLFFWGGVLPVLAVLALALLLPESPRYLARHRARWPELVRVLRRMGHPVAEDSEFQDGAADRISRTSFAALVQPPFRADTIALCCAFFSCLLAVYLGFSWVPSMLAGAGFSSSLANTGITAFNLGGVAGAIAGGLCISRIGSRISMLTMTAGAVASTATLGLMVIAKGADPFPILVMLTIAGALINGVQTTMYALAAHVYPTEIRATGVGTAAAVGRIGAVLSGYVGAWALDYRGNTSFFLVMAGAMTACFVALAAVRRHVTA